MVTPGRSTQRSSLSCGLTGGTHALSATTKTSPMSKASLRPSACSTSAGEPSRFASPSCLSCPPGSTTTSPGSECANGHRQTLHSTCTPFQAARPRPTGSSPASSSSRRKPSYLWRRASLLPLSATPFGKTWVRPESSPRGSQARWTERWRWLICRQSFRRAREAATVLQALTSGPRPRYLRASCTSPSFRRPPPPPAVPRARQRRPRKSAVLC
mmetsp:Transcript_33945/g.67577  ORF Transcript_33945/g.67577 Transcript_33945/m.67577 type:complete len:214 (+) Transcript_33945:1242-1883(+)